MPPKERTSPRLRAVRYALLLLIPALALGLWHWMQPDDRLSAPYDPYCRPSLIYDEFDYAAMAMRGLNAELGRQPGAVANPGLIRWEYFTQLLEAPRPLKARYFLEYPHAALVVFR